MAQSSNIERPREEMRQKEAAPDRDPKRILDGLSAIENLPPAQRDAVKNVLTPQANFSDPTHPVVRLLTSQPNRDVAALVACAMQQASVEEGDQKRILGIITGGTEVPGDQRRAA